MISACPLSPSAGRAVGFRALGFKVYIPPHSMSPWRCASPPGWWSSCPSAICWKPKFRVNMVGLTPRGQAEEEALPEVREGMAIGKRSPTLALTMNPHFWNNHTRQVSSGVAPATSLMSPQTISRWSSLREATLQTLGSRYQGTPHHLQSRTAHFIKRNQSQL